MALPATSPAPVRYARVRTMLPEIMKFCVVGGLGTVIDLGGAGVLHSTYHVEPLAAKAASVTLATLFTYLGSRFWTFRHRENQSMRREAVLFFVLNVVGLVIAEAAIGLVSYALGLRGAVAYNAASVIGTGLGTIFRFYAYRKWVFLDPARQAPASATPGGATSVPDYPPWELDPKFLAPAEAAPQARAWPQSQTQGRPQSEATAPSWSRAPVPRDTAPAVPASRPVHAGPRPAGRHRKS
jgi:putative flippase GtrA